MNFYKFFLIFFVILILTAPVLALAACSEDLKFLAGEYEECIENQTAKSNISCDQQYPWCKGKVGDIAGLVRNFYNYALAAVGVAALGAIIFGGIKYTVSAGNPSGQADAISWITGAVWGLVLLLGANLLLRTIGGTRLVNLEMEKLVPVEVKKQESKKEEPIRYNVGYECKYQTTNAIGITSTHTMSSYPNLEKCQQSCQCPLNGCNDSVGKNFNCQLLR